MTDVNATIVFDAAMAKRDVGAQMDEHLTRIARDLKRQLELAAKAANSLLSAQVPDVDWEEVTTESLYRVFKEFLAEEMSK